MYKVVKGMEDEEGETGTTCQQCGMIEARRVSDNINKRKCELPLQSPHG